MIKEIATILVFGYVRYATVKFYRNLYVVGTKITTSVL